MKDTERICTITIEGEKMEVPFNTPVMEVFNKHYGENREHIASLLNNRLFGLTTPIRADYEIKPITRHDRVGQTVYRRSASFILREAVRRLYPGSRLVIGQSIQDGYFFNLENHPEGVTKHMIEALQIEMRKIVEEDLPFKVESHFVDEVKRSFLKSGEFAKANLLRIHWWAQVRLIHLGGTEDLFHDPYVPSTSYCDLFELAPYWPGMVLRFPARHKKTIPGKISQLPTLFNTYMESRQWNQMLGVENLGQLNGAVFNGDIDHIIKVAEGLHEKKIASIADSISKRQPDVRLVIIAGPSSSGKTTFSKRLAIQLMVNGIRPMTIEMDNFFVERDQTPRDEKGDYDFESIDAIDIELFNDVLVKLMEGETVPIPVFDFKKGGKIPKEKWIPKKLEKDQVLIIEGIHGLNERLTQNVLGHRKFKIYISALTQLCIDDHNRIYTSDTRLIRRIIRDRNFRGYSAADTINRWPSVRAGEMKHIFPFQEKADVMFNSALVYEPGVLKTVCERALLEVQPENPAFAEAFRLLRFLRLVMPISKAHVPPNSIMREFIGNSSFHY